MSNYPKTKIEFIDTTTGADAFVKVREIHINGQKVMVKKDGASLDWEGDCVTVTLTILADSVHFRRENDIPTHL